MHAVVFRVTIHEPEEALRLLHEELVPTLSGAPGFVAGYWLGKEDQGTGVVVFQSEEAALGALEQAPRPPADVVSLESAEVQEVVAHA
jgi:hypothetical protein